MFLFNALRPTTFPDLRLRRLLVPVARPAHRYDLAPEERTFARLYITERQLEILSWVQHGKSARDIGGILGISPRTVEHQMEKVSESFGVRTRVQAVLKVRDLGVLAYPTRVFHTARPRA